MAKDYAKTGINDKVAPKEKTRSHYGILLIIVVAIVGLYLTVQSDLLSQLKQTLIGAVIAPPQKEKASPVIAGHKPHFEFYTLLPKNEQAAETYIDPNSVSSIKTSVIPTIVMSQAQANDTAINTTPKITAPSEHQMNGHYLLQVAAYRTIAEADRLKAKLVLLGYGVSLENFNNHGITWYRVKVGPYATMDQAKVIQEQLRQHKYNSILRKG